MDDEKPSWKIAIKDYQPRFSSFYELLDELAWWRDLFRASEDVEVCKKEAELIEIFLIKVSEVLKSIE